MARKSWFERQRDAERRQEEQNERYALRTRTRRRDWTYFGGSVDRAIAREMGGCFISESGNRGEAGVMASWEYVPEAAEEEARLSANDRLRRFVSAEDLEEREAMDGDTGPKYIALEGTVDEALTELLRKSPKFVIEAYKASDRTGRLDVLNRLPRVIAGLVNEGVYTLEQFQQTPNGNGFSCYQTLKGYASTERGVIGPEGGIACRILEVLRARLAEASA